MSRTVFFSDAGQPLTGPSGESLQSSAAKSWATSLCGTSNTPCRSAGGTLLLVPAITTRYPSFRDEAEARDSAAGTVDFIEQYGSPSNMHGPMTQAVQEASVEVRRVDPAHGAAAVVEVTGDIDNSTAPLLREELLAAHDDGARLIVVDLTPTDFLDSSALGALVGVHKAIQPSGATLRIVCTKPHLRRVFEITRMVEVIPVFDSLEVALKS